MDEMNKQIIMGLQAYAMGIMAKDLSGRFPNPGRVIRNVQNVTETVQQLQTGQANPLLQLLQGGLQLPAAPVQVEAPKAKTEPQYVTKKQFFDFRSDIMAEFKKLAPPPAAP